ncbi:MAG: Rrf2 family transcriptional regulator, partial [Chloroflexota bacterium]|nr:Rrf2 family transcriptional regulator [Chloroflexota bacterium]
WRLLRRPEQMTLLEVYRAVDGDRGLPRHHRPPNPDCVFGRHMERALDGFFREAEAAMERKLAEFTVAEVVQAILGACGHRAQQVAD